ncbi:glycosyltransferase 87 family protein [Streptomyces sp. SAS_269]|uniref:glycosyltransferase 87 family protein n=1 Tax=Streptomyces sp. SAS_269 TaxID=3412749 RepID=UPI00403C8137
MNGGRTGARVKRTGGWPAALPWTWCATRLALLLLVFRVVSLPGADVTTDVSVIYQSWSEVLRQGTFPLNDVTWQYPPAAALAILSPALLPFLGYAPAFFVLSCLADLVVFGLLAYAGRRPERSSRGAWIWVAGLPLLGPTAYARYDLMVTAVAVAALLAGTRYPRVMGALAAFGALLKVWPALLLVGATRLRAWLSAAVTAGGVAALFAVAMPGAFAFLAFQRDRGTEVESLGGLVLHVARRFGWPGEVVLNYGSVEFLGPYVGVVDKAAVALTAGAVSWLLLWRLRATRFEPHTLADAAFTAVLLLTVTSRVISPQYLVWLIGLAAVCGCFRASRAGRPAALVLAAAFVTLLEFPIGFVHVIVSDTYGVALLLLRNALLLTAALTAARALWRTTVPAATAPPPPPRTPRTKEASSSP